MQDVLFYLVMPFAAELMIIGMLLGLAVLINRWRRLRWEWRIEQQAMEDRYELYTQRKRVPCRACVREGRLCPAHTAEIVAQLQKIAG